VANFNSFGTVANVPRGRYYVCFEVQAEYADLVYKGEIVPTVTSTPSPSAEPAELASSSSAAAVAVAQQPAAAAATTPTTSENEDLIDLPLVKGARMVEEGACVKYLHNVNEVVLLGLLKPITVDTDGLSVKISITNSNTAKVKKAGFVIRSLKLVPCKTFGMVRKYFYKAEKVFHIEGFFVLHNEVHLSK